MIKWYAAGGDIALTGPFDSQVSAWDAMRYASDIAARTRMSHPENTRVWPERLDTRTCEVCGRKARETGSEPRCEEHDNERENGQ